MTNDVNPEKRSIHFYSPGNECAACLDASVAKGFASLDRIQAGKEMLVRIVAMLTKLLMHFDPEQYRVHKNEADLAAPFEHEHDDEHDVSAEALAKVEHGSKAILKDPRKNSKLY